jgi:Phosphodiester glycosidase
MSRAFIITAIALFPGAIQAETTVQPLFNGVSYHQIVRTSPLPMVAHVITLDLTKPGLRISVTPPDRSQGMEQVAQTVSDRLVAARAQVVINASYFLPFNGGSQNGEDYYPKSGQGAQVAGAARGDGRQVSPAEIDLDLRVNSIVCMTGARISIADGQVCPALTRDAVAAGPRLLTNGSVTPLPPFDFSKADARGPRTAIGISADQRTAYLVVVDGRQADYSMGASLPELVTLFQELGASNAINLDGGGSAAMSMAQADGSATLLSRPIHTGVPGRERPVANHVIIYAAALPALPR